jgi:hypothetical protein
LAIYVTFLAFYVTCFWRGVLLSDHSEQQTAPIYAIQPPMAYNLSLRLYTPMYVTLLWDIYFEVEPVGREGGPFYAIYAPFYAIYMTFCTLRSNPLAAKVGHMKARAAKKLKWIHRRGENIYIYILVIVL